MITGIPVEAMLNEAVQQFVDHNLAVLIESGAERVGSA